MKKYLVVWDNLSLPCWAATHVSSGIKGTRKWMATGEWCQSDRLKARIVAKEGRSRDDETSQWREIRLDQCKRATVVKEWIAEKSELEGNGCCSEFCDRS
jgi:hypothetical protein